MCGGAGVKTWKDKNDGGRKEECFTQTRLHLLTAGFLQHEARELQRNSDFCFWCLFSFPDCSDGQQELKIDHFSSYSKARSGCLQLIALCALNLTCNDVKL